MTKTPEQLAEEWQKDWWGPYQADSNLQLATRVAFVHGYQAAKYQLAAADKVMNSPKKLDSWISVKERLPEVWAPCLVTCHEERYTIAEYDGIKWTTLNSIAYYHPTVTHWMPLPEAPKEEA